MRGVTKEEVNGSFLPGVAFRQVTEWARPADFVFGLRYNSGFFCGMFEF
jgi:hypothetical protein